MIKISTLIIILSIWFPFTIKAREFYLMSIISPILILYIGSKYMDKFKNRYKDNILLLLLSTTITIYSIYIIIITLNENKNLFLFSFNKLVTLILFIFLIIYFSSLSLDSIYSIKKNIIYSIITISMIAILLYFFGIDGLDFNIKPNLTTSNETLQWYRERRIHWLYEHKIHFASVCLIGLFLLFESTEVKNINKIIFSISIILAIYLSNSKLSLLGILMIFIYYMIKKLIINFFKINNKSKMFYWYIYFILCLVFIIILYSLSNDMLISIGNTRDLSTFGSRTIIWESVIKEIKNNPVGLIKSYGVMFYNGVFEYTTAHNTILNEYLETGIIGGSLYLTIYILVLYMLKGYSNKCIFIIIMFLGQFDYLISGMFAYIFWLVMSVLIAEDNLRKDLNNPELYN